MVGTKADFFKDMGYVPSPGQQEFHNSSARFKVFAAGSRFGKSMMAGAEVAYEFLRPNHRIWIIGTQYDLAEKEFNWALQFLARVKLPNGRNILDMCKIINRQLGPKRIESSWGSSICTKSSEKLTSLLGEEIDMAVLSEASQHSTISWERYIRRALGSRLGSLLAISTPNADGGLFAGFFKLGMSGQDAEWKSWQYMTKDNPHFSTQEWATAKKELSSKVFEEQYEGKFVSRRGHVFDIADNFILDVPPENLAQLPILLGFHSGFKNPSVCIFCSITEQGLVYISGEVYMEEKTLNEVAGEIVSKIKGLRVLGMVLDASDKEAVRCMKEHGFAVSFNNDEKRIGRNQSQIKRIQAVQNILKPDNYQVAFLGKACPKTLEAMRQVKWQEREAEDDRLLAEIPNSKYMSACFALAHVVCFLGVSAGRNVYGV